MSSSESEWGGMRTCPYCGIENVLLPAHLPHCDETDPTPHAGGEQA